MEEREAQKRRVVEPEGQETATLHGMVTIENAIEGIQGTLDGDDLHASVADLVRLLELRRELGEFDADPLTVRWIGEWQQTPAREE